MSQNQNVVSKTNLNHNNNTKNHILSISSKRKIDLSVNGKFSKSFKHSLSSSNSMRQKPKIFNPKQYKDFLKNQKIFIEMYYRGTLIDSGYEPYIVAMGGQVYKRLSPNVSVILTNHLTKQSLNNLNKRILKVNKNYIPIASILWLEQIYRQKRKIPKEQFLLTQDDIENPQQQRNIEKLPDYFQQEITQDLIAELNQNQKQIKVKNRFFHLVDKKNKKQVLSKLEQQYADYSIIQAQSFVVTHNKILQKNPKKKKPKKQINPFQIQKKAKKISEAPLPKSQSKKIKYSQKKSKSQSKSKNQNKNQNNQVTFQKQSLKKQQNSHPPISLDFLLQQYCKAEEENQIQNQDTSNTFMKRQKQVKIDQNYRQDSSARSTISVQKTKRSRSNYDIESNYNKYSQKLDDKYNNFYNIYQNQPSERYSNFSSRTNNNLNSQLKKQQIQQQITIQLQSMIRKQLQQLRYIEPEKDQFCINVLCRDQKILSYVKKFNEKYYKRQNFKTYYFNLINQPEFTDKVNRNQMFRRYFQVQKRQYLQMPETENAVKGDSQQQRMVIKRALNEIRQKLGCPKIFYLCDKNCKLDCLYAQLSPLPKNQIVDFNIIKAIADLNSKIIHDYQHQKIDEAVKNKDQKTNIMKPFVYMKIVELYLVKTIINFDLINKKRLTILDSTILKSSLQYIIQKLGGILVRPMDYLVSRQKCDVVITAKRSIKIQESYRKKKEIEWFVDVQRFIDCLIKVQV